jgi:hypothetical protein
LFSIDEFWPSIEDYDNPDAKITIQSGSNTGVLGATILPIFLTLKSSGNADDNRFTG